MLCIRPTRYEYDQNLKKKTSKFQRTPTFYIHFYTLPLLAKTSRCDSALRGKNVAPMVQHYLSVPEKMANWNGCNLSVYFLNNAISSGAAFRCKLQTPEILRIPAINKKKTSCKACTCKIHQTNLTSKIIGGWIQWPNMQLLFKFKWIGCKLRILEIPC